MRRRIGSHTTQRTTLQAAIASVVALVLISAAALGGCAGAGTEATFQPFPEGLDYTEKNNWYALSQDPQAAIDVFVIYPTVVMDDIESSYIVDVDSPRMVSGVQQFVDSSLAPILDGLDINVFIPKYRQFNASGYGDLTYSSAFSEYLSLPRMDIYNAYNHYLEHLNGGRDYIIISHSQGSALAAMLLTDYASKYQTESAQKQMQAAYMAGWGLTDAIISDSPYLPSVAPDDKNTIISWNTATSSEVTGDTDRFTWGDITTRSINPVSWQADTATAAAIDNPMSVVYPPDADEPSQKTAWTSAKVLRPVDKGGSFIGEVVLIDRDETEWMSQEQIALCDSLNLGYAHTSDLRFFAGSIRANIISRVGVKEKDGVRVAVDTSSNGEDLQPYVNGMNYADDNNWLRKDTVEGATTDVFVIEPTAVFDPQKPLFDDPTDEAIEGPHAAFNADTVDSIFEGLPVNVYTPRYRQANGNYILSIKKSEPIYWSDKSGPTVPVQDIFNAFSYYMHKFNNGNRIVLISHSQGSVVGRYLITEFIPKALDAEQQKQVALYYMFGYPLTDDVLAKSPYPASTTPTDTGTIISWNTGTPTEVANMFRSSWGDETTHAVNPITFDTRTDHAPATENPKSLWSPDAVKEHTQTIDNMTGAQLVQTSKGGWVVQVDFEADKYLTPDQIAAQDEFNIGYTHRNDACMFYEPIRKNFIKRMGLE